MARVVLIVPPGLPGTTPNREGAAGLGAVESGEDGFCYPPHTVATVAATLRAAGYDVAAVDAVTLGNDVARCLETTLAAQPALIGVYVSWATREADARFLAALQCAAQAPAVAFGVSVRFMREALASADYLLEGEPELAFPALCARVLSEHGAGQPDSKPRVVAPASLGVAGYDAQGLLTDLDALPYPAWDLLPIEHYPYLSLMSSRGCVLTCGWCPYVVAQGHRFRAGSPARVVAELAEIVRRYHPRRVVFRDPAFAHDRARVVEICQRILAGGVVSPFPLRPGKNLLWECESHPAHFDRSLLHLMALAGCIGIKVGLETTDAELLCREGRVAHREQAASYLAHGTALARACVRWGIAFRPFLMAGLPGQTLASAQETARFVDMLPSAAVSIKALKHYPGLRLSATPLPQAEELRAQMAALSRAGQTRPMDRGHPFLRRWAALERRLAQAWFAWHGRKG